MQQLVLLASLAGQACAGAAQTHSATILKSEFIYETAPFPECHASTIAQTESNFVAAWFGGTQERNPDVGIWLSRLEENKWTAPVEVANGKQIDGKRYPCWNPVLFQPQGGPLLLFYKIGPSPSRWWGMLMTSDDLGKTWSAPRRHSWPHQKQTGAAEQRRYSLPEQH